MQVPPTVRQFVKDLEQVISQSNAQARMQLAKGQISSMEQYNRFVGRIEGMEGAVGAAKDMIRAMQDAEDNSKLPEMPKASGDAQ